MRGARRDDRLPSTGQRVAPHHHVDPGADRGIGGCRLHFRPQNDPDCDDDTLSAERRTGLAGRAFLCEGPAGSPGRKLTDGPADTEPAPSPDLAHVAYVHKANVSDYGGELWILDLSPARTPVGAPRRLVDPGALPPGFGSPASGDGPPKVVRPRWSPTGNRIAFLEAGEGYYEPDGTWKRTYIGRTAPGDRTAIVTGALDRSGPLVATDASILRP